MAKDKKNTIKTEQSTNHFLKNEKDKRELAQEHKDFLGMSIPDKYFTKSKNSILNSLPTEQKQNNNIFKLKPFIAYPIAASFIILISVFIWINYDQTNIESEITNTESIEILNNDSEDYLVTSLFIEDDQLEAFLDDYMVEEILVKAELSEQQLENLLINSLFIEDSLINSYLDNNLVETLVL